MDAHQGFSFRDCILDLRRGALLRGGVEVSLRPKSFGVLRVLLERHGELVTKDDLLAAIWGKRVVTDGALTQCLIDIRRAIGDEAHEVVRTVPRRGYVFAAPVTLAPAAAAADALQPPSAQDLGPSPEQPGEARFPASPAPKPARAPAKRSAARSREAIWGAGLALLLVALLWPRPVPVHSDASRRTTSGPGAGAQASVILGAAPAASPAAREAFVRARFFFHRRMDGDLERARLAYVEALRIEPAFAAAWAGLAGVYRAQVGEPGVDVPALMRQRRDAIAAALRLDPALPEAHLRAAAYYHETGRGAQAAREAAKAVELAPDDPAVLAWRADRLRNEGRYDEAIALKRRVVEADPLSLISRANLANDLLAAGRLDEARVEFRRALEIDPGSRAGIGIDLVRILLLEGRYSEALAQASEWPRGVDRDFVVAVAQTALQRRDAAAAAVERLGANTTAAAAVRIAELHAYRGEADEAFRWLGIAYDRLGPDARFSGEWQWLYHLQYSPFLRPLQSDPRWTAATKRAEQLTVWRGP